MLASAQDFNFDEINYSPARTVFKLFAPGKAKNVELNVYAKGDVAVDPKPVVKKRMRRLGDNLWTVELKGDQKGNSIRSTSERARLQVCSPRRWE